MQVETKKLKFNQAQLRFIVNLMRAKSATSVWGRGTGKSFIIGWLIKEIVKLMPRSVWIIAGKSFLQIKSRTIISTKNALEQVCGWVEGVDYIIGRKPPASWKWARPYENPSDYTNFMSFPNGTCFMFTSQTGGNSSRGPNSDGIICDESLEINIKTFGEELVPTKRANMSKFGHVPMHLGIFHFSSMPYGGGTRWLTDHGNYYNKDGHSYRDLKQQIVELELEFLRNKDIEYRFELWKKIEQQKKLIKYYISDEGMFYSEADVFDNLDNLSIGYIEQQYKSLNILNFLVEILNWYPDKVEDGFYPSFSRERHGYAAPHNEDFINSLEPDAEAIMHPDSRIDADCIPTQPLRIAVDWGKFNSMTITQYYKSTNTLRFIKDLYTKHPLILTDLANLFCTYYRYHNDKSVIFLYGHDGNKSNANSNLTYAQQFAQILKRNGWGVTFASRGAAPTQADKYLLTGKIFKGTDHLLPKVEFNRENCASTILSLNNAKIIESHKGIGKDKRSERSLFLAQEEATHLSDTVDMHIMDLFSNHLSFQSPYAGL